MNREQVIKLAEELYNWSGRAGGHKQLWADTTKEVQATYINEAEFILQEFIERHFGYRLVPELKVMGDKRIARALEKQEMFHGEDLSGAIDVGDRLIAKAQRDYDLQQIGEANG